MSTAEATVFVRTLFFNSRMSTMGNDFLVIGPVAYTEAQLIMPKFARQLRHYNFSHSEHPRVTDERNFTPPNANKLENSSMSSHSATHGSNILVPFLISSLAGMELWYQRVGFLEPIIKRLAHRFNFLRHRVGQVFLFPDVGT